MDKPICVDIRNPINTGPHDAVTAVIGARVPVAVTQPASKNVARRRVKWAKVDKLKYLDLTEVRLGALQEFEDELPPSILAHRVNTILQECGEESWPPPPKKNFVSKLSLNGTPR